MIWFSKITQQEDWHRDEVREFLLRLLKCNEQYIRFAINDPIYMIDAYRQENTLCYKLLENKSF